MAETLVSDVIVPELFLPYVQQRTAELSRFWQSGIIATDSAFDALASSGGTIIDMPFWNDLSGSDQVVSDTASLTTKKLTASQDAAAIHNRADAWATNDLAGILAGDDPMMRIGDLVAAYWARKHQDQALSTVKGIFASATMAALSLDIFQSNGAVDEAVHCLNGLTFLDGKQLMGDAKEKLTAICMHSLVETYLKKKDLIDTIPDSEGKASISVFQGLRVIVDDGMTTETVDNKTVFTTLLFGQGAIALGVAAPTGAPVEKGGIGTWEIEFAREALAGQNIMINRKRFILHPRGVRFLGANVAGKSPTNAELALDTNWSRVYDVKNLRIVRIRHNIK